MSNAKDVLRLSVMLLVGTVVMFGLFLWFGGSVRPNDSPRAVCDQALTTDVDVRQYQCPTVSF